MALLLFDLDGTLLRSGGAGVRAMTRAGRSLFGPDFSLEGVIVAGGLDPILYQEVTQRLGITDASARHEEFCELYLSLLEEELATHPDRVTALPGIKPLLDLLDEREDTTIGLVTGNYRRAGPLKLRAAGIQPERFRVQVFGDDAPDRRAMVALALESHAKGNGLPVDPAHVVVVGDTPRDVQCARENACRSCAVATGGYSEVELSQAGASITVPDLADPEPLLQLLAGGDTCAPSR